MNRSKRLLCLSLLFATAACTANVPLHESPARNVLFVGNSFTYYNNSLHHHYRELLRAAMPDAASLGRIRAMTISGGRLPEHAAGLASMLASQDWDIVVLQGHSRDPIDAESAASFSAAATDYARRILDSGATPVFFMTWAYTDAAEMTPLLDTAYSDLGREFEAPVVPVGLAFEAVTAERPDIELRTDDGRHPTLAGTYLAACTFFAVLEGISPAGNDYSATLDAETAAYLQRAAWAVVRRYQQR